MPEPFTMAILGGTAIASSIFGSKAADKAAKQQTAAQERAIAERRAAEGRAIGSINEGSTQALGFLEGDREAGDLAREQTLTALGLRGSEPQQQFFDGFQSDPGFQATVDAGIETIDRSASSRGQTLSGGTLRALQEFGQRSQFDQFQKRLDRLSALSTTGTQANTNSATIANQAGANRANIQAGTGAAVAGGLANIGTIQAGGTINAANQITSALGNFGKLAAGIPGQTANAAPTQGLNAIGPFQTTTFSGPGAIA